MNQLEDVLKDLGWESYESKAYCTLVKYGASKLNDLSFRSHVPEGKIYSIMARLEKRGAVLKTGKRPQIYDAQNPRHILENEQNQLIKKCAQALESAEQAWEIRTEKMDETEKVWQMMGISGILGEIRRSSESSCNSIIMLISDLDWFTSKDSNMIESYLNNGGVIDIVTLNDLKSNIQNRLDPRINIRISEELPMNFCIFDCNTVLWITGNYEVASIIKDESLVALLEIEFGKIFENGSPLGGERIVS